MGHLRSDAWNGHSMQVSLWPLAAVATLRQSAACRALPTCPDDELKCNAGTTLSVPVVHQPRIGMTAGLNVACTQRASIEPAW